MIELHLSKWAGLCLAIAAVAGCGGGSGSSADTPAPDLPDITPVATGCQTTSSYRPWGTADLRTWTPREASGGAPFEARLVLAFGDAAFHSPRQAVLEQADGCRRRVDADSLSDADVAVVDAAIAAHPAAPDPASYALAYETDRASQAAVDNGTLIAYSTQHFTFWRGINASGFSNKYVAARGGWDAFLQGSGAFMEALWLMNRDVLGAPMPYTGAADRKKINVYVCGTGLPFIAEGDLDDCWASAADAMWVSALAMAAQPVIAHEFGHVLQFYSGGFRDKGDAGPIWETGAEWNAYALTPLADALPFYVDNLENGPLFSHSRYGAFPFILHLQEQDSTRDLVWKTWQSNLRTATGATTEDYVQALVRLGQAQGSFPNGYRSFADDIGRYGAQLATMDFQARQGLMPVLQGPAGQPLTAKRYVPLTATSKTNVYASPAERPLLEYGTHVVPLTAQPGKVTVQLTGGTTANQAAWRLSLVALAPNGSVRYSQMAAAEGTGSAATAIDHQAGEALYLSVTATPYVYETLGWQAVGATTGTTFPYKVQFANATPRTGSATLCDAAAPVNVWDLNYDTNGHHEGGAPCR